jgi:hypothetical protein
MVKYCSTEMGNRVCYQSMQVHGGVGYMREFNIERLFRDVRITNIYEGTSQLQVVAAIGKLLNRSLDPLLAEWSAAEYPEDMAAEKAMLVGLTGVFQRAVDSLKAQGDRAKVDYYACDLVDQAVWLTCSWLLLRDTNFSESKKSVARAYVASIAPRLRAQAEVVVAANSVPLEAFPILVG